MPHAFAIYPSRRFIYCVLWGDIAAVEIVTLRQSLAADPRFDPSYAMLVVLQDVDLTRLTSGVIATLASSTTFGPSARRAFVAAEPTHFGVARMFQIQRELSGIVSDILVCRTLSEALTWLSVKDFTAPSLMDV